MKRTIYVLSLLVISILFQISCSDDLLEPKPLSFFNPDKIFTNKEGFDALITTMRKNLVGENHGNNSLNHLLPETAMSDLGGPLSYLNMYNYLVPTATNIFSNMFYRIYGYIKETNVLITRIDNITWTNENERNVLLAEAYWFRSYWYYRLVNSFGDVPFIGKEVTGAKLDFSTHSRWAILDKIQSDMEFAVQWLPITSEPGAPTKGAGNHLLAKICLANCKLDEAIEAATNVINGPYALMKNRFGSTGNDPGFNLMWDLHRVENKNIASNTETILAVVDRYEAPDAAKTAGCFSMRFYNCTWWHSFVKDSQGLRGMVRTLPTPYLSQYEQLGLGNPDVMMTKWYYWDIWSEGGYTYKNTPDLRRGADTNWVEKDEIYYTNPESVDYGKPVNIAYFASATDSNLLLFPICHYKTYAPQQNPLTQPQGGNGDWYIYRLAETYLVRAEAYYLKGQPGLAANDINVVRQRANAIPISAGDVTMDYILNERAKELYIEEMRHGELNRAGFVLAKLNKDGYSLETFSDKNLWHDRLMKYNVFYSSVPPIGFSYSGTALAAPYHALWPIPDQVITANTGARINQNEGYTGAENNVPPLEIVD
jgi:hypothetical protein